MKPPTFEQQNVTVYVYQGSSVPVPPEYFKVSDPDTSVQDLRFRMTQGPVHGRLVNLIENSQVDVQEGVDEPHDKFIASAFRYNHDGLNIEDDHIVVEVSDGKHTGLLNIFVHVIPVDQEAPTLDGGTMSMEVPEGRVALFEHTLTENHSNWRFQKYQLQQNGLSNTCINFSKLNDDSKCTIRYSYIPISVIFKSNNFCALCSILDTVFAEINAPGA